MKKAVIILILIFLVLVRISSAPIEVAHDSFTIQAGYGAVQEVSFHEIPAQSYSYIAGMPFNIEEQFVQYGQTENGRQIATIDMLSNQPMKLIFNGEQMMHEIEESTPLDYIITIEYEEGRFSNNSIVEGDSKTFTFDSRTSDAELILGEDADANTFIGSVDGLVYFMFTRKSSSVIAGADDSTLPPGNYGARVWVTIEPLEGGTV